MVDGSESDILFDDPKIKSKKRPTRRQKAGEKQPPRRIQENKKEKK